MQGLNFRKKRGRGNKLRKKRKNRGAELHFEDSAQRLNLTKERIYRRSGGAKGITVWIVEIVLICMTAVFLVAAFGQKVTVSGDSMAPVLRNGDAVLVNRLVYKIKNPARGDIVAYRQNTEEHFYVKRIVGLPGETVQISEGKILIDGEEYTEDIYAENIEYAGIASDPVELGEDEYFVIGDSHTASDDSRSPEIGSISFEEIYGEIWFVAGPVSDFGPV